MRYNIALSFVSLAVLAAATPAPAPWTETTSSASTITLTVTATAPAVTVTAPAGTCTTGPVQCCQSVEKADSEKGKGILGLLDIVLTDFNVLLGLTCSPITGVGIGSGNTCTETTVCCENNNVGGLISIGCIPIFL